MSAAKMFSLLLQYYLEIKRCNVEAGNNILDDVSEA